MRQEILGSEQQKQTNQTNQTKQKRLTKTGDNVFFR